ncbi:hypothetical protein HKX48_004902 [Thoreauomyces humboldtii]|nr:hypothetical protein HKX48_004902 [Thoreauomyces humboldtii]
MTAIMAPDLDAELLLPAPVTTTTDAIDLQSAQQQQLDRKQTIKARRQQFSKACIVVAAAAIALSVTNTVFRKSFVERSRSTSDTCASDLANGRWIEESDTKGWWKTNKCFLRPYAKKDAVKCLKHTQAVFVGDSTARTAYLALREKLLPNAPQIEDKHQNQNAETDHVSLYFYWDPFWNVTDFKNPPWIGTTGEKKEDDGTESSLVLFSAGHWFMRLAGESGEKDFEAALNKVLDGAAERERDGTGNGNEKILVRPVTPVVDSKLNAGRQGLLTNEKVVRYNSIVDAVFETRTSESVEHATYISNLYSAGEHLTEDGLHYDAKVLESEVQMHLNKACNQDYARFPAMSATCCATYPTVKSQQLVTLLAFAVMGVATWIWRTTDRTMDAKGGPHSSPIFQRVTGILDVYLPTEVAAKDLAIIGLAVLYMLVVDRTSLFTKVNKIFSYPAFGALALICIVPGLSTIKTEKDSTFLNRHQTDEWKGWMQLAILVYHYTGASSVTPIYAVIRVMVASYLFMTGYGHFTFFYKKDTFTFARAASVLVRLNLLSAAMAYTMDRDILFYYFGPLVSFWFIVLWVTMRVGHQYNKTTSFLLTKIVVAAVASYMFIRVPWCLETLFEGLEKVGNVEWDAKESSFRLILDHLVVFAGMITAFVVIQTPDHLVSVHRTKAIVGSTVVMVLYAVLIGNVDSKFEYNALHPYVSPFVVVSFTILRNATPGVRSQTSGFFRWVGANSLELFLVQYHVWLAVDTKGVVVLDLPGWFGSEPMAIVTFGVVFFAIAERVSGASARIVERIASPKVGKWRVGVVMAVLVGWNWTWW